MMYDVLFLDHGGMVFTSAVMEADDDQAAIELAGRVHRTTIGSGYEIRRRGVVIHVEEYGPSLSVNSVAHAPRQARA